MLNFSNTEAQVIKTPNSATPETTLGQDLRQAARYYLGGRRGMIVLVLVVPVIAAALNWSWLVAIGVAPLLLGLLPCAAMCALGLCMSRAAGEQSCPGGKATEASTVTRMAVDASQSDPNGIDLKVSAEASTAIPTTAEMTSTRNSTEQENIDEKD